MLHKAMALAGSGDVIVVDAGGDLTDAPMGEMMPMRMVKRGLAGIALGGAVRDAGFIRGRTPDFPLSAAGVTRRGPYGNGPVATGSGRATRRSGTMMACFACPPMRSRRCSRERRPDAAPGEADGEHPGRHARPVPGG